MEVEEQHLLAIGINLVINLCDCSCADIPGCQVGATVLKDMNSSEFLLEIIQIALIAKTAVNLIHPVKAPFDIAVTPPFQARASGCVVAEAVPADIVDSIPFPMALRLRE